MQDLHEEITVAQQNCTLMYSHLTKAGKQSRCQSTKKQACTAQANTHKKNCTMNEFENARIEI